MPFKVVIYSLAQLIKGNTKGVTLKVSVVVVKYQAAQYSRVGLAKLLFRNIGLLITVRKDSQFKVKIIVFTAILRLVGIELSQVSQLLAIGLYLGGLRIYSLSRLRIYSLGDRRVLVRILVCGGIIVYNLGYGGIAVRNLSTRYTLAYKINSKTTQVYRINLVKQVVNKTRDPIKFKRGKESASFNVVQDLLFGPFYLVLLIQYIVQGPCNSNLPVLFNLYTLVT